MSTRRKSRRNTRKSRKQLLKGGGGAAWHSDPSKSFEELVSEFRPLGTDSETGYALDADLVADYYWNKAMTQVVEKDGKLRIKYPENTPVGSRVFGSKLMNKGNSSAKILIEKATDAAKTRHAEKMKTNVLNMMKDFIKKYNVHSTELKIKPNLAQEAPEVLDDQHAFLTAREEENTDKKEKNWHTVPDTGGYLLGKTLDSIGNFIWAQSDMWCLRSWGLSVKHDKQLDTSVKAGEYHYGLNGMAGFENCAKLLCCCNVIAHKNGIYTATDDDTHEKYSTLVPDNEKMMGRKIFPDRDRSAFCELDILKVNKSGKRSTHYSKPKYPIVDWLTVTGGKGTIQSEYINRVEKIYKYIIKSFVKRYYLSKEDREKMIQEDNDNFTAMADGETLGEPLTFSPYISYKKVEELLKKDPSGENTGIKTEAKTTEGGRKGRRRKRRTRRKGKSQRKKRTRRRKKRRR